MPFQPRWRSVLLGLIACCATHAYRGAGEQAALGAGEGAARPIGARAHGNCREAAADVAAGMPDRVAGLRMSALDVRLTDASQPVCVYVGQALRVHLPASPAVGYEWVLEDGVPPLLRLETDPGGEPASWLRTGTASVQSWEFRAERPGHAALRFVYRRPWEVRSKQTRTSQFDVIVL
jgi:predicted secreted protein